MSGMFDKKTDKVARKQALTVKEEKERKKRKTVTVIICVAFVLLLSVSLVVNSAFIRRTLPVVTIDGIDFSTAEFEFFFNTEHMEYLEFANQFQGMVPVPDPVRALSAQIYDEVTGETWADFITGRTLQRMAGAVSLYNAAMDYGFVLSEDDLDLIENEVMMRQFEASMHGFPNANSYLQRIFGFSINEQIYRDILKFIITADMFNAHMQDSFNYTEQQLEAFYAENADSLDVFTYRVLTITPEMPLTDEFEDGLEFEEVAGQALADAYELAGQIASGITDEESFIAAAGEYNEWFADPAATIRLEMGERLDADLSSWLLESRRQSGDITVVETGQGPAVVYFISRDDNNYRTLSMHQLLISRERVDPMEFELGDGDPEYKEAVELAKQAATQRALEAYEIFVAGDTTKEALIALMAEHSDDTTPDGFYENIALFSYQGTTFRSMRLVPEIEEWLFDEDRTIGDFELIETADFGYHLVMFSGSGGYFSNLIADDRMRAADHNQWHEGLSVGEPQRRGAFILVSM